MLYKYTCEGETYTVHEGHNVNRLGTIETKPQKDERAKGSQKLQAKGNEEQTDSLLCSII